MDLRSNSSGVLDHAIPRIELSGEYDLSSKEEIASLFQSLRPDGGAVIDMTKVTYVDSSFLHELADLQFRFMPHAVTLVGVSENLKRVFAILSFDRLFTIIKA